MLGATAHSKAECGAKRENQCGHNNLDFHLLSPIFVNGSGCTQYIEHRASQSKQKCGLDAHPSNLSLEIEHLTWCGDKIMRLAQEKECKKGHPLSDALSCSIAGEDQQL